MSPSPLRSRSRLLAVGAVVLLCTLFFYMRQSSLFALLSAAPAVESKLKWYPPSDNQINSLTSAINGEGTYGFIFDTSETPDEKYGTYNWCNMPHARKREYKKPAKEFELQYVEVVST